MLFLAIVAVTARIYDEGAIKEVTTGKYLDCDLTTARKPCTFVDSSDQIFALTAPCGASTLDFFCITISEVNSTGLCVGWTAAMRSGAQAYRCIDPPSGGPSKVVNQWTYQDITGKLYNQQYEPTLYCLQKSGELKNCNEATNYADIAFVSPMYVCNTDFLCEVAAPGQPGAESLAQCNATCRPPEAPR